MIPYHKPLKIEVDFTDIFESGIFTNDKYCRLLEYEIERLYKCTCYVCSNGTMGLLLSLFILQDSKRISMPAFNWFSDEYILNIMNRDIVYRDIDRDTWLTQDFPTSLRLHTFGNSDPYEREKDDDIFDGTHCLGTKFKRLGSATIISLAPTKMVTSGEGGLILLKEPNEKIKEYRDKCSRMSEFHAKIGLNYLKSLDKILNWKKKVYNYYKKHLDGKFQEIPYHSNYNTIGMLTKLKMPSEIETKQYYIPLCNGLMNTQYVYDNIICLPSYYNVDYKKVVELIEDAN